MCKFKSGLIMKTRCVIAPGENNSHSALLEELNIVDNGWNAMNVFVRAELLPPNNEWWTDPDTWTANIDQDYVPEWFETDKERYIAEFRAAVKEWWKQHVFVGQEIEGLSNGYFLLRDCHVSFLDKGACVVLMNSRVNNMLDNSLVRGMRNSTIENMFDKSVVQEMCDNSTVKMMYHFSQILEMCGSSKVQEMRNNSAVLSMFEYSTIQRMYQNSSVKIMFNASVVEEMHDCAMIKDISDRSTIREMYDCSVVLNMSGDSTVQKMYGSSVIKGIYNGSGVREMYEHSIAIDRTTNKTIIHVAEKADMAMETHKNQKEEQKNGK